MKTRRENAYKVTWDANYLLVEAQGNVGITRLDKASECTNLLGTPKHRSELEPKLIGILGFPGTPSVDTKIKRENINKNISEGLSVFWLRTCGLLMSSSR